jgi:DNA-binding NarL/FixJ family response regulator
MSRTNADITGGATDTVRPIRVLCVDDHRLVLEGLSLIIAREQDMQVVATAVTGDEAIALFKHHRPDITLMDLQLPVMSGLEAIDRIRQEDPGARIIVLTTYQGDENIFRAISGGAATYLLKDTIADDLVRTIREVHEGRYRLSEEVTTRLSERASRRSLTPRETQVIDLIAHGFRNKEIAAALGISEETVQVHVKNLLAKLGVHDRTAAIRVALQRGIIDLQP